MIPAAFPEIRAIPDETEALSWRHHRRRASLRRRRIAARRTAETRYCLTQRFPSSLELAEQFLAQRRHDLRPGFRVLVHDLEGVLE